MSPLPDLHLGRVDPYAVGLQRHLVAIRAALHRRVNVAPALGREGIEGGDGLSIDKEEVMEYIQDLRDHFVDQVLTTSTDEMGEEFIEAHSDPIFIRTNKNHTLYLNETDT